MLDGLAVYDGEGNGASISILGWLMTKEENLKDDKIRRS